MWNINALRDFHKICRICSSFQDALAVKASLNLLKELCSYGGFKLTGSGYPPNIQCPYRRKYASDPQKFERCKNVLEILYRHAKFVVVLYRPPSFVNFLDELEHMLDEVTALPG